MESKQISVNPFLIALLLGTAALFLVFASIGGQLSAHMTGHNLIYKLAQLFDLNAEQNIPTFFSTFLLLFVALLLVVITVLERNRTSPNDLYWTILSFGFFVMAVDEFVSIHERLISPVRTLLGDGKFGIFYFAWVIPGIALFFIIVFFFFRFWLRLPAKTRLTFFVAATIYIGGCIGFELIGGHYAELHGMENLTYGMIATVEESLEMGGIIVFIWGLLTYIAENYKEVRFLFDGDRGDATNNGQRSLTIRLRSIAAGELRR